MSDIFEDIKYKSNEPLKNHTTMRVGGPAEYLFLPENADEITRIIDYCKSADKKYIIIGNGSNMVFSDEGFNGIVIKLFNNMNSIKSEGEMIIADAGSILSKLASYARDNSLTGMEFAAGIPGTLGGAVVMNAGAYGGEMKDIIEYVDVLLTDGSIKRFTNDEMKFGYRTSAVKNDMIVISAGIRLKKGNKSDIEATMLELKEKRTSKQPLEYPSSGSTFKRPEGHFAGKLIEDAGLKGYRVGGAMVSEKHAGFVINYDNATAEDIVKLIEDVRNTVKEKFGVLLEPEVKIIR
ncbi:MAG: UDP-N-acetylmuramate dehydrogenase [Lachnospiraceae bacterium]|nr:UDP-N-acetylmuramate dehydrogenase [Lachnospiraceae bacterium]